MTAAPSDSGGTGDDTEFESDRAAVIAAVIAVAATYFFFLVFAQTAMIELARPLAEGDTWRLRGVLSVLAITGVLGSFGAAIRFRVDLWQTQLSWSFRACGAAAVLGMVASNWTVVLMMAAATGMALGWLTVTLAAGLRPSVGTPRLGWIVGWGTGLAYALGNLPGVFDAAPRTQAIMAAVLAGCATLSAPFLTPMEPSVSTTSFYRLGSVVRWLAVLLVLVGLDSLAFTVLQNDDVMRANIWSGSGQLLLIGIAHLAAGIGAGVLLDRGWRWLPLVGAYVVLALVCFWLGRGATVATSWVYAGAVSGYSTVLVYLPARSGRVWIAAWVFAIAGWVGAALGMGAAEGMRVVPFSWILATTLVVAAFLAWRWREAGTENQSS